MGLGRAVRDEQMYGGAMTFGYARVLWAVLFPPFAFPLQLWADSWISSDGTHFNRVFYLMSMLFSGRAIIRFFRIDFLDPPTRTATFSIMEL
ncbi:hypothetical protein U1Q18_041900 [Sarracenia purpurea var. burkii]